MGIFEAFEEFEVNSFITRRCRKHGGKNCEIIYIFAHTRCSAFQMEYQQKYEKQQCHNVCQLSCLYGRDGGLVRRSRCVFSSSESQVHTWKLHTKATEHHFG